tara:strand:- start:3094 stop:3759 length:666 start_codon:yes stop_codon:yes gene_type:complete
MSHYVIHREPGDGGLYFCETCGDLYFSPLPDVPTICLDCLYSNRNRNRLIKVYGPSYKDSLEENTMLTQSEVGNIMGISRQRVQQIEIIAMAKVRAYLIKSNETKIKLSIMNQVAIVGKVVRDAQVRETKNGNPMLTVTIVTEKVGTEDRTFQTYWDVLSFGDKAISLADKLKEGAAAFATGEVSVSTYENKDGATKASLKCVGTVGVIGGIPKDDTDQMF